MAIAQVGGNIDPTSNTTTTTWTSGAFPTVQDNDVGFIANINRDSTADPSISDSNGGSSAGGEWIKLGSVTSELTIWYKVLTAADSGMTVTSSGNTGSCTGFARAIRGIDVSGTPYAHLSHESNASGNETHAGFTNTIDGGEINLIISSLAIVSGGYTSYAATDPSTLGELNDNSSTGGNDCRCGGAAGFQSVTGATGSFTWAGTNAAGRSIVFVWKPDSGQALTPGLFTDGDSFFAATVAPGAVSAAPGLLSDGDSFHAATVAASNGLAPGRLTDGETFHGPTAAPGAVAVLPGLVSDGDAFHAATVAASYGLAPGLYSDTETFHAAVVSAGGDALLPGLLSDGDSFHAPNVTPGAVGLLPGIVSDADSFPAAVIATSYGLTPGLFADSDVFHAAAVEALNALLPSLLPDTDAFHAASVAAASALLPALLEAAALIYVPVIGGGASSPIVIVLPGDGLGRYGRPVPRDAGARGAAAEATARDVAGNPQGRPAVRPATPRN